MKYVGLFFLLMTTAVSAQTLRVATFNVSMEATNYQEKGQAIDSQKLSQLLQNGQHQQIRNIAEIIQRVRPDVILLNEFDYIAEPNKGVQAFVNNYLAQPQADQQPISYPYFYIAPVNTGLPTPYDLDNDGKQSNYGGDAQGFGLYEGQYGMVVLSKYPIKKEQARTLQTFLWKDMPDHRVTIDPTTKQPWYSEQEWKNLRLSSKSHWDLPIEVNGKLFHLLAMHPTPPVFDGEEDRNGNRNHDEIRLMADYIDPKRSQYIYDDNGVKGGLKNDARFVIVGDLNAADTGDKHRPGVIEQLLDNPKVFSNFTPQSEGGSEHSEESASRSYTAHWAARVDYVLPSKFGFQLVNSGVFWPSKEDQLFRLVESRHASSDHRLVWIDVEVK
ncbi:endonuclease/exonuclease/phosphatase family protein [Pseudoalteromonas sp. Isolate6]|uniref:endonuclease/exonuclease/phosphatase family protein n=1 Tax=Pseudoalteromonas sp. Isolate6 TaxID=2908527 RepID=UPI001EFD33CE|nr:endonuclease/exonuclease/phosphatase family protein [Pseudoalteromonas sp. Isolate6]MCG9758800.1 endonuclease/exonuclease/phosphatase family protein [Pseudoalteromonas sp. Isolate6]